MCSGLPLHLLHDGQTLRHTPPRLSAFTEAPRQAIDAVMDQHAVVRHLIGNGWMHLFWLEPRGSGVAIEFFSRQSCQLVASAPPASSDKPSRCPDRRHTFPPMASAPRTRRAAGVAQK